MPESRRQFIKAASAGIATTGWAAAKAAERGSGRGQIDETKDIKVGLIGCGGRGSGAAAQALTADPKAKLMVMADVFEDRLNNSMRGLSKKFEGKVDVPEDRRFLGFDAYKKVMESDVDVVLLTTPPVFRPMMFEAAIEAGKHVFCEKPMAVDGPGIRKLMAAVEKSKEKNLSVVAGFCWRYHPPKQGLYEKIHAGEIGDVLAVYNTYLTGPTWHKARQPEWSDMEWHLKNWVQTPWISGDHIVEQAIHSIDMMMWAFGDPKVERVVGNGGRQAYADDDLRYMNCFDHFSCFFELPDGRRGFHQSRKEPGCDSRYDCEIIGSEGKAFAMKAATLKDGKPSWKYKGKGGNMYQVEHDELFKSIRTGEFINDGEWMANSTLAGIMARMACYTGKTVTYKQAFESEQTGLPEKISFETPIELGPVPVPGRTKLI